MDKTLIIIITYNGQQYIKECLDGIYNKEGFDIFLIDNGSSDDTAEIIEKNYPHVKFKKNAENVGFGQGNNIGLSFALKHNYDYVALLNQDTEVNLETLKALILKMKLYPHYGILSPLHYYAENILQKSFSSHIKANNHLHNDIIKGGFSKEIYELPFVNAAIWMMSKECIRKVGGFCPAFFHYGEDDNYCHRVLYHGFKIGIVPNTRAYHYSKDKHPNYFKDKAVLYLMQKETLKFLNPMYNYKYNRELFLTFLRCVKNMLLFRKNTLILLKHLFKMIFMDISSLKNLKEQSKYNQAAFI